MNIFTAIDAGNKYRQRSIFQTAHGRSKAVTVLYFHMNCMLYYKKFKIPGVYGVAVARLFSKFNLNLLWFRCLLSLHTKVSTLALISVKCGVLAIWVVIFHYSGLLTLCMRSANILYWRSLIVDNALAIGDVSGIHCLHQWQAYKMPTWGPKSATIGVGCSCKHTHFKVIQNSTKLKLLKVVYHG